MSDTLEARLRQLREEREAADRRYNEALTALDRALPGAPALEDPRLALDDGRLAELNTAWNILPDTPSAPGLKGRLAGFIWRTIAPYLQRQLSFNSILVDHVNRNVEARRAAHARDLAAAAELRRYTARLAELHGHLMVYLQQITAYVDTKDRDTAGGTLVLNAALSDLAEAQGKYRESFDARDARMNAVIAAQDELRGMVAIVQQALVSLRRHVESGATPTSERPRAQTSEPQNTGASAPRDAFAPSLDAYKYVGFEDQFRGSRDAIRERQESYVPAFASARAGEGDVLDVGCGRGEFIELLQAHGITARGIDLNHEMAESCRARGLNVEQADAVSYLSGLSDGSLAGIFAAQVVEHLEPSYLLQFLDLAFVKLRPGGTMVLETLNPACWTAFFESYIRDITHRWPLHPETLKYLVTASGFTRVEIEYRSPVAAEHKLQPVAVPHDAGVVLQDLLETFNGNVQRLNDRMFSFMDYAVVAQKG